MFHTCLGVESMRFSTVDEDAARISLPGEAETARRFHESVAIHAALGPMAIEMRLKEIDREIASKKSGRESHAALFLGAIGHDGPICRRRFFYSTAGAGLLAWSAAPRWSDMVRPDKQRENQGTQALQQEREALSKLKEELS